MFEVTACKVRITFEPKRLFETIFKICFLSTEILRLRRNFSTLAGAEGRINAVIAGDAVQDLQATVLEAVLGPGLVCQLRAFILVASQIAKS